MTNPISAGDTSPVFARPAAPENLYLAILTATTAVITWNAGAGGAPVAYYRALHTGLPGGWVAASRGNETFISIKALSPNSHHDFYIFAVGFDEIYSLASEPINCITPEEVYSWPPDPPAEDKMS